ncbi:MAG: hypothetical protein JW850_23010 [Thermoflexales bacterium]|nr:hypothetical protein [Thermoflexales bacterium]
MKSSKVLLLVTAALMLAALACGGSSKTATPAPAAGGAQATAAPAASGGQETQPTKAPAGEKDTPAAGGGTEERLNLGSVAEGLAKLKSYKGHMVMKFTGKDAEGQAVEQVVDMVQESVAEPYAQRILFTSETLQGPSGQDGSFEIITLEGINYIVFSEQGGESMCMSASADESQDFQEGMLSPEAIGGIQDGEYIKTETVNGIQAKRYKWKGSTGELNQMGFTSSQGEVWVAVDGEYVVKYTVTATGKGSVFGEGEEEGTIAIEYNLTEVNKSIKIEAPAGCATAAADIPVMPDAQDKAMMGEMVTYSTPSPFADVVAFYNDEMPKAGWQASGEPTEMEGLAMLEFSKENRKAQLMISKDEEKNVVNVMISTSEE